MPRTSYDRARSLFERLIAAGYEHHDPRYDWGEPEWSVYLRGGPFDASAYVHVAAPDGHYVVRVSDHPQAVDSRGRVVGGWTPDGRHDPADISIHPGSGLTIVVVAAALARERAADGTVEAALARLAAR